MLYLWDLSRQRVGARGAGPEHDGCWMTNSVQLVSATVMQWPPQTP